MSIFYISDYIGIIRKPERKTLWHVFSLLVKKCSTLIKVLVQTSIAFWNGNTPLKTVNMHYNFWRKIGKVKMFFLPCLKKNDWLQCTSSQLPWKLQASKNCSPSALYCVISCHRKNCFSLAYAWQEDILNHITWGEETVKSVIHNFWMQKSGIKYKAVKQAELAHCSAGFTWHSFLSLSFSSCLHIVKDQ